MDIKKDSRLPAKLAAIRDAAVASADGGGVGPKDLGKLFAWAFWNTGAPDFDQPYISLTRLNLSNADVRDALELLDNQVVTEEHVLECARVQIGRMWEDGEAVSFAHTFSLERPDGKSTYLCGLSWPAGQGGHETHCDGLFGSMSEYLQFLEGAGMTNLSGSELSLAQLRKSWGRDR